ncbi:MucBP domain-containing protein [Weissella confusa]|uniref:MucBP domain-containing protein n=1 Tax=Weissella confusa TaxID=1583 RepID=UPI002FDBCF0F
MRRGLFMLGDNVGPYKRPVFGVKKRFLVSGATLMMLGMAPDVRADDAERMSTMVVGTADDASAENGARDPKNWELSTDVSVAQTVMTTVNGAVNADGKVLPAGSSFVQLVDARIVNGYAIGLTIDNTTGQYQTGDTLSIPLYGEMTSASDQHKQTFNLVPATGVLQNDGATFARYEVSGRTLKITFTTTPIGEVSSHLTITGSTSSPLSEAKIWAEKTSTAKIIFGDAEVTGSFAFKSRFQVDAPGVATQQLFTKSDQVSVGSYYQDDGYMNALLRGDVAITAKIRATGTFATEDLIQLQHVQIEQGTVLSASSSAGYSTYYVVDKNAAGKYQATVISATVAQMNTESIESQNYIEYAEGTSDDEIVRDLAKVGRGAYTIHLNADGSYTMAYNMGNPYADWGIDNFSDETFGEFLLNRDADGTLTAAELKILDENIARAGGANPSEGTGSHGHQFYIHFADNTAVNAVTSVLKTYNANGELLNTTKAARAVTTPDIVDIKGQARLRVFHIDEGGHELAATEAKIANPGTPYETEAKEIEDFQLLRVTDNATGSYGKANETTSVVYVYVATLVDDPDYSFEDDVEEPEDPAVPLEDEPEVPSEPTVDEPNEPGQPRVAVPEDPIVDVPTSPTVEPQINPQNPEPELPVKDVPTETPKLVVNQNVAPVVALQTPDVETVNLNRVAGMASPTLVEKVAVELPQTAAQQPDNAWLKWAGLSGMAFVGLHCYNVSTG